MNDIAIAAGVSRTTVSHALSGTGRIAPETRERIRRMAAEARFTPNPRALALKTGRSGVLAIVNAVSAELAGGSGEFAYFTTAAASAAGEAIVAGYTLALVPLTSQDTWLERLDIEGAVVMDPIEHDPLAAVLRRRGLPFVTIGRQIGDDAGDEPYVSVDFAAGTELALDHLWARGARRPALLVTTERRSYGVVSKRTYEAWSRAHEVMPLSLALPETGAEAVARSAVSKLLRQHPELDAVYTPVDSFAVGAVAAVTDANLSIPDRIRIVTLEGVRARACYPQLTALDDRPGDAARAAIRILIDVLRGESDESVPAPLRPELIVRGST